MKVCYHTYAIDAAKIITNCRKDLHEIISFSNSLNPENVNPNITDLDRTLLSTEQFLHYHLLSLIDQIYQHEEEQKIAMETGLGIGGMERPGSGNFFKKSSSNVPFTTTMTLMETAQEFKRLSENERERRRQREREHTVSSSENISAVVGVLAPDEADPSPSLSLSSQPQQASNTSTSTIGMGSKSATDSLLFRLIVILQLCQVRIDESKSILCTRANFRTIPLMTMYALSSIGTTVVTATLTESPSTSSSTRSRTTVQRMKVPKNILVIEKGVSFGLVCLIVRRIWRKLCMNTRLLNTSLLLEDWQQQWMLIQSVGPGEDGGGGTKRQTEEQCKRLLQLMPFQSTSSVRMTNLDLSYSFFTKAIFPKLAQL